MRKANTLQKEMTAAARDVLADSELVSPTDLVMRLADIEEQKQRLTRMLKVCRASITQPIEDMHHQLLHDYTLMLAARHGIDSNIVLEELRFKYMIEDLADLKTRDFWDALIFVRAYVEGKI